MFLYSTEKCGKIVENDSPPFLCEKKRWSQKKRSIRIAVARRVRLRGFMRKEKVEPKETVYKGCCGSPYSSARIYAKRKGGAKRNGL
jgi:hypothetical protein